MRGSVVVNIVQKESFLGDIWKYQHTAYNVYKSVRQTDTNRKPMDHNDLMKNVLRSDVS